MFETKFSIWVSTAFRRAAWRAKSPNSNGLSLQIAITGRLLARVVQSQLNVKESVRGFYTPAHVPYASVGDVCLDVKVKDRMINVSEILPLRPIKVNNGKFYLLLRSGYFVNGCVFTRVYVICKSCEKLRRIHSCRYLLDLSQSVLQ